MLPTISNPLDGEPSLTAFWAGLLITLLLASGGCSLDFDQFEDAPPPETVDMSGGDTAMPDMGPGTDAEAPDTGGPDAPDMLPPGLVIGASCSDDTECPGGSCADGYCTIACVHSSECPVGASCREFNGVAGCVADCVDDSCAGVAERDDLSCVYAVTTDGRFAKSCLVDSDGDTVPDTNDPCPDDPEGRTTDTDSDGEGDACDAEPLCLPGHTDGIVDLGSVGSMVTDISVPSFVDGPIIPIWGGRQEMANVAAITYLDIRDGTFTDGGMLPRPGVQFASAPLNGGWLLTPGARDFDEQQVGRFLEVRTGGISTSFVVDELIHEPTLLTLESGEIYLHAYTEPANSRWTIWRWNRELARFQGVTGGAGGDRVKWRAFRDGSGYGYFYSQGRDLSQRGYLVRVDGSSSTIRTVDWPDIYAPFDPFIVAGNGGSFWAYERTDGRAWTFTFDDTNIIRTNDFDIQVNLENTQWVATTGGPGFVLIGQQPMAADEWVARGFSLPCFANASALDRDGDTVPDVLDNCPADANELQEGLDDDLLGNACDSDDDGDSRSDTSEITTDVDGNVTADTSLDTDNDGENNDVDTDRDGDGIPDAEDRWPLDTDNDRIPNQLDRDDDDDGYSDFQEIALDTDPLDSLSIPNGGRVVWVADGAERTVQVSTLEGDRSIVDISVGGIAAPHKPRLATSHVLALDGPPDQATGVTFTEATSGGTTTTYNFAAPLRGADVDPSGGTEPPTLFLVSENDDGIYELSNLFAADALDTRTVLFDDFDVIDGPHVSNDGEVFIAAPPGCTECNVLYRRRTMLEPMGFINVQNPRVVGYSLGTMIFVADDVEGVERLFRMVGSEAREIETPMWDRIDSVAPLNTGNHVLVSAAMPGGTFDIWFYNGLKDRWEPFATSDDDLIELDWKP